MHDPDGFARRLDLAFRVRRIGKMHALAVALDIDGSALSRWRRGKPISVDSLVRLCGHLRISIDWLLTGAGTMEAGVPAAAEAWQAEVIADLASLDPAVRASFAELIGRLSAARGMDGWASDAWSSGACGRRNGAAPRAAAGHAAGKHRSAGCRDGSPATPAGAGCSAQRPHGHPEPS